MSLEPSLFRKTRARLPGSTMLAGPTMGGRHAEPTSDGRTQRAMADWTSLRYVVVDVEGNGRQPPDLVELATVPIADGVIGEPVSWLVGPDTPITPLARKIHGITN